ncbi:MAG: hypothetical protein JJT82_09075 [Legionellaceae bacterium]|nr:hypothetical protein [Legionellaceae bacterium]
MVATLVDNSGQGNCMYYAYAISLMYYLRAQSDELISEKIFTRLGLDDTNRKLLQGLLALRREKNEKFSKGDIKIVIEPVLGTACRKTAGESVRQEFMRNPQGTQMVAVLTGPLSQAFHLSLRKAGSEYALLLEAATLPADITGAELFKVPGMPQRIADYANRHSQALLADFQKQWSDYQEARQNDGAWSETECLRYQQELMNNLVQQQSIAFFKSDRYIHLNAYISHLQTNYVWGSEDTLLSLHEYLMGPQVLRDEQTQRVMSITYDTPMKLAIFSNGCDVTRSGASADIIVDNRYNMHWVSRIPETQYPGQIRTLGKGLAEEHGSRVLDSQTRSLYAARLELCRLRAKRDALLQEAEFLERLGKYILPPALVVMALCATMLVAVAVATLVFSFALIPVLLAVAVIGLLLGGVTTLAVYGSQWEAQNEEEIAQEAWEKSCASLERLERQNRESLALQTKGSVTTLGKDVPEQNPSQSTTVLPQSPRVSDAPKVVKKEDPQRLSQSPAFFTPVSQPKARLPVPGNVPGKSS